MRIILAVLCSIGFSTAPAAELVIPNTFTAGTPARAADVNANFSAVKAAVDGKQNRVTGICAVGSAIREIKADGTVTCDAYVKSGKVVVGPAAFAASDFSKVVSGECLPAFDLGFHFKGTANGPFCMAYAPLNLPHGATLTLLSCTVADTSIYANTDISAGVTRQWRFNPVDEPVMGTLASVASGTLTSPPLGGRSLVNNDEYTYLLRLTLRASTTFNNVVDSLAMHSCEITYTMP
jgi:hypothetical protein